MPHHFNEYIYFNLVKPIQQMDHAIITQWITAVFLTY